MATSSVPLFRYVDGDMMVLKLIVRHSKKGSDCSLRKLRKLQVVIICNNQILVQWTSCWTNLSVKNCTKVHKREICSGNMFNKSNIQKNLLWVNLWGIQLLIFLYHNLCYVLCCTCKWVNHWEQPEYLKINDFIKQILFTKWIFSNNVYHWNKTCALYKSLSRDIQSSIVPLIHFYLIVFFCMVTLWHVILCPV